MGGWASGVAGVLPCAFLGSAAPSSPCVPGLVSLPSGARLGVASLPFRGLCQYCLAEVSGFLEL